MAVVELIEEANKLIIILVIENPMVAKILITKILKAMVNIVVINITKIIEALVRCIIQDKIVVAIEVVVGMHFAWHQIHQILIMVTFLASFLVMFKAACLAFIIPFRASFLASSIIMASFQVAFVVMASCQAWVAIDTFQAFRVNCS